MEPVKTKLSVREFNKFKAFVEAIGLTTVDISYYGEVSSTMHFALDNLITYTYNSNNEHDRELLVYLVLKYGGLEGAYLDYHNRLLNLYRNI